MRCEQKRNNDLFKAQIDAVKERRRLEKTAASEGTKIKDSESGQNDTVSDSEGEREIC